MSSRVNVTAWIESKGRASLETVFQLSGSKYDRAGDAKVANLLSLPAACEGIKAAVTASAVGKARSRMGLVAYRSPRGPKAPSTRDPVAIVEAPSFPLFEAAPEPPDIGATVGEELPWVSAGPLPEADPGLGRIAVALESIAERLGVLVILQGASKGLADADQGAVEIMESEGWWRPKGAIVQHYFRVAPRNFAGPAGSVSLCRGWTDTREGVLLYEARPRLAACRLCSAALKKHPMIVAELDADLYRRSVEQGTGERILEHWPAKPGKEGA